MKRIVTFFLIIALLLSGCKSNDMIILDSKQNDWACFNKIIKGDSANVVNLILEQVKWNQGEKKFSFNHQITWKGKQIGYAEDVGYLLDIKNRKYAILTQEQREQFNLALGVLPYGFSELYSDSIKIDPYVIDLVKKNKDEIVIRVFSGEFMKAFSEKKPIAYVVNDKSILPLLLSINENGSIAIHRYEQMKIETYNTDRLFDWKEFYKFAVNTELIFPNDTVVDRVVCLDGKLAEEGVGIYYYTNKGEFLLYKELMEEEQLYMFPIEDFYNFSRLFITTPDFVKNGYDLNEYIIDISK